MDMQIAERLMTADELMGLDIDDHIKVELVQGVLVTMPPANIQDSMLASHSTFLIGMHIQQHQLGIVILKGDELLTGGDVLPNFSHPVNDIFSVLEAN